jgi:DNA-binding NarL/FixJ family response regulator
MQKHKNKISILIHCANDIFRHGIIQILSVERDLEIVGISENCDLLEQLQTKQPDIVLMWVELGQPDIIAAVHAITEKYPNIAVIAACEFDHNDLLVEMVGAGAKGLLLKSAEKREITDAIAAVYTLGYYYSRAIAGKLANLLKSHELKKFGLDGIPRLPEKDKAFIQLVCKGYSVKEIATATGVSRYAVEARRKQLYRKLELRSVVDVVNYAILHGLYNPHSLAC